MPRPNMSLTQVIDLLKNAPSYSLDFNELLEMFDYSEVTLRTNIKRMLFEGFITVDRNTKPYTYTLTDQGRAL